MKLPAITALKPCASGVRVLLWLVLAIAGCDKPTSSSSTGASGPASKPTSSVAVVDLDRVGKAMGWNDQIQHDLRQTDADLKRQLDERVRGLVASVQEKKKSIGSAARLNTQQMEELTRAVEARDLEKLPLSKEQRDDLTGSVGTANRELQALQNSYQQILRQRQVALITAYRDEVRPVARRVATANGMTAVVTPGDNLLFYDPSIDITDKVVDDLQKAPPVHKAPDVPRLEVPATQPMKQSP